MAVAFSRQSTEASSRTLSSVPEERGRRGTQGARADNGDSPDPIDATSRIRSRGSCRTAEVPRVDDRAMALRNPDGPDPYRQWALYRCGFPTVWPALDTGPDPGEIAVIDRGGKGLNHRELAGRVTRKPAPSSTSRAAHAAAVAAVIAARRDEHGGQTGIWFKQRGAHLGLGARRKHSHRNRGPPIRLQVP